MNKHSETVCLNHKPVQVDGMDAERPGLGSNHADMFQPRIARYVDSMPHLICVTACEFDVIDSQQGAYWVGRDQFITANHGYGIVKMRGDIAFTAETFNIYLNTYVQ